MFLYPYKIFALSKNKRLLNASEPNRPLGIYDVEKMSYLQACKNAENLGEEYKVSVLLGPVHEDIKLICLDLDDCFDEDMNLERETEEFLKEFSPSEYEVSSSGTGIHVYILTRLNIETFIVKNLEGCKSFECYTNKRHIVTTYFDFENEPLYIGRHDEFLKRFYERVQKQKQSTIKEDVKVVFDGTEVRDDMEVYLRYNRPNFTPVTDMYTLRGLGYKDPAIIEVIDENPDAVDQSAHDAKLIRKLMYYTGSFESAWELATKTNYWKAKDAFHKKKWNTDRYKDKTRCFLLG